GSASRVEREFARLAEEGEPFPLFAVSPYATEAERAAVVKAAFEKGRQAFGAAQYMRPPPALLSLIQSGKLTQVGLALPRKGPWEEGQTTWAQGPDGVVRATTAKGAAAPPVGSLAEFMSALVCTILPALAAQPAAAQEWLALARTVLEIHALHGW